jgi:outer membrane lipoprotein-sorting protein
VKAPQPDPISWGMTSPRTIALTGLALVLALAGPGTGLAQTGQPLELPPAALPGSAGAGLAAPPRIPAVPRVVPVPRPRPASLGDALPDEGIEDSAPKPARPTPARAAAPAEPVQQAALDLTPNQLLDRVNASLNAMSQMSADFVQIGGNGRRLEGKLYVSKPGRLRFEYKPPATVEIVADGSSVVIRDKKLGTQDSYPLSQTPLKFLLKEQLDLSRDTRIIEIRGDADLVTAQIEDRTTFGGTSRVQMVFDPRSFALKQWTVVDPQGYQTVVNLSNVDLRHRPDPDLFYVDTTRVLGQGK